MTNVIKKWDALRKGLVLTSGYQHRYVCGCRDRAAHGVYQYQVDTSRCNGSCCVDSVPMADIKRVVALLKGRGDQLTMRAIAVKLGVHRSTLNSWLLGSKPGPKATDVLRGLLKDCPLTNDECERIRGRAHGAMALGEVFIEPVQSKEAAEAQVECGRADLIGEHEPETYMFMQGPVPGPRRYVVYRFINRELAAEVAKLPTSWR